MRKRKINLKKVIFCIFAIILIIILGIIICNKIIENNKIKMQEKEMQEKINQLFILDDLELNYDQIRQKYGLGTDNINGQNKLFCTTYVSEFEGFKVTKMYYYDDSMQVEKIDIYNYENSKYEILNFLIQNLGEEYEYNNEIKELSTEYKWKTGNYEIELKDNIYSNSIIIQKIDN